jgi:hypothetical protein
LSIAGSLVDLFENLRNFWRKSVRDSIFQIELSKLQKRLSLLALSLEILVMRVEEARTQVCAR